MKHFLLFLAFFSSAFFAGAQDYIIKGTVNDTLNSNKLEMAAVTLIRASDSTLETFTRTAADGSFTLRTPNKDKYILMIGYPSFADYVDIVNLKENKTVNLGEIPLVTKTHLLNEFVLKQQLGAIKIKGDTTEYMADSFLTRQNATVEELLKKLPGLQVNKNGEVVAQGETVKKILVDGEEFFTDDPAVVTKSLQAKSVESVQVYDKKSDQAEFTGIDDGVREKTINLKLKEDAKKGYFGKLKLGGGTDGYFENQAMINAFKGKRKLSAFGIVANTGKIGLGWKENDQFGAGNQRGFTEDGFSYSITSTDDELSAWRGTYDGQGLPKAWTGGLHYSNKWVQDKYHLAGNYRVAKQNIETVGNTLTQYNLAGQQYYTDERNTSFSTGQRHRADGLFEWKTDSLSELKLTANANYSNTKTDTKAGTKSIDTAGNIINDNTNNTFIDAASKSLNALVSYRKKFNKKGRTVAVTVEENFKETTSDASFFSSTSVIRDTVNFQQTFDQNKNNDNRQFQIQGQATYTEPLSKILFLELNYALVVNNSSSRRLTFNKNPTDGRYTDLDSIFSSNYDFDVLTNTGGTALRFVFKKINFSLGGAASNTKFNQHNNFTNADSKRDFNNFFPRANFTWRPKGQQSLHINYRGSTRQPTISQIQPIRDNTDPLNFAIGNPSLRQEFDQTIDVGYHDYKMLSGTYRYLGGSFTIVNDDISRSETIDASRIRRYQYVNVDGNYNGYLYAGIGTEIKKIDLRVNVNVNASVGRNNTFINNIKNESNNNSFTLGLDFDKDEEDKFDMGFNPSISYNSNTSSVNATTTNFFTYQIDYDITVQLPFKFEVSTEVNWNIRQKVAAFDGNNNVFRWDAYVSRKFLKSDELEIRASVWDILNQNIGFSRYGNGNTITQQNYNTIRRYGLLSLIWNFTKRNSAAPKEDGIQIDLN